MPERTGAAPKRYRLLGADGATYESDTPGVLGGNRRGRIYGRLDCSAAQRALAGGVYKRYRVFFADEAAAIAAGYRPCYSCMRSRYAEWKRGGERGTAAYPWKTSPERRRWT